MMEFDMNKPIYWYKNRADSEIQFLLMFVDDIEAQCKDALKKYTDGLETVVLEEDEATNTYDAYSHYRGLDSQSWDLDGIFKDYFPNLQRGSALITLFGFFENEMDRLCYLFIKTEKYKVKLSDIKGNGLERSVNYLKKVAELNCNTDESLWRRIANIQEVRNRFTHHRGCLSTHDIFENDDEPRFNFDDSEIVGEKKGKKNIYFIKEEQNLELSGYTIRIKEGYLKEVLVVFSEFYKSVDVEIQKKYTI